MATLSGNKIKDTYQSLVKFSDNGNITTSAKQLTDGFGNNSPMFVSTTQVGIGVTPESGLNLHVFGDAKIGSNLTVIGNLVVEGSTTTVGTDTLTVKDPLIVLANNNTSTDAVDIGFYGKYHPSGTTLYSGLFREALTGKYRLFKGLEVEPTTTVNTSGTGYAQATLIAALEGDVTGNVTGNLTGNVTGGTFSGTLLSNVVATTQSAGDNSTKVATTAYVDNQVGLYDTLSEVLANGNTTGGTNIAVSAGDDITFTDTSKSIYGTDGELKIHHNGTNSYITEDGTGALYLQGTYMYLTKSDGSQNYIELDLDGATDSRVKLNYGGATKLTTTSTGVSITGVISGLTDPSAAQDAATKNYVDTQVGANNELSEVLANGNTSGGTSMIISNGDDLTVNTSTLKVDSTNSQVGINNSSPSGFTSNSKDLIIGDGTGNRGITIYSSSMGYGHLFFQDAESSSSTNGGFISYTHNGDGFEIGVAGAGLGAGSLSIGSVSIFARKKLIVDATYSSTNTLTVDPSNARVGIFNDSPSYRLDVAGTGRFTGQIIATGDLIVDTDTLFVDVSEDSVGIGLTNPADYSADELVISVPDTSGMTLVSAATDTAYITFAKGTTAAAQSNFISHDHSTDNLTIFSQAKVSIGIQEAIVAYFTDVAFFVDKSTTIDDTLTVNGNSTINGNVTLSQPTNGSDAILNLTSKSAAGNSRTSSIEYDADNEYMYFKNAGTTVATMTSGGNVGIGVTPAFKLDSRTSTAGDRAVIGINSATTGTNYGGQFNCTGSGATKNIGLYVTAEGATTNVAAIFDSGDVGIGTASPTSKLTVSGPSNAASNTPSQAIVDIVGSSTAHLLMGTASVSPYGAWINTDATGQPLVLQGTGGNVGIGISSPSKLLHLLGADATVQIQGSGTSSNAGVDFFPRDGSNVAHLQSIKGVGSSLTFLTGGNSGNSYVPTERMRIDSSGNVGINNTNPSAFNSLGGGGVVIGDGTQTNNLTLYSATTGGGVGYGHIAFADSNSSGSTAQYAGLIQYYHGTDEMSLYTNSSPRLTIDSSGNVGIGVTPANWNTITPIQVKNSAFAGLSSGNTHVAYMSSNFFYQSGDKYIANGQATVYTQANGKHSFYSAPENTSGAGAALTFTERMRIDSSGNVGIGTDSPQAKLHINPTTTDEIAIAINGTQNYSAGQFQRIAAGDASSLNRLAIGFGYDNPVDWAIRYSSYGRHEFYTGNDWGNAANTERMVIDSSGLVSIKNAGVPTLRLDNTDQTINTNQEVNTIQFYTNDTSTAGTGITSKISQIAENAGNEYAMTFYTYNSGALLTERMRITNTGTARFKTQSGAYGYGAGYNFHEFNNDFGNQPIAMFWQASGSGSHYGINVHNNDDENDTTSRFFLGQGGSTERIKIYSNGNIENTNNSYGQLSDIKLKENITDATSKLDDLMQVQIKNFNYIGDEKKQIGVIAQELEEIFPALIYETQKTEYKKVDKTDEEGNIIYETEEVLISEAVEGQELIEWEDKPTIDNTKSEIQTWLDNNNIEWQSADTKQELLDRISEYKQEAIEAQDAVYETRETYIPETVNKELPTGDPIKGVKYSVLVPIMIKAMQEQQQIINDLKSRIETLENK